MQNPKDIKDFDNFMAKVDNLDSILKGLTSDDSNIQANAMAKADEELKKCQAEEIKITSDRTIINKSSDDVPNPGPTFPEAQTSQSEFLAAMEEDCRRRATARKERHKKANDVKEVGNTEFKAGNFEKAIEEYTKAMTIAKDLTPLYTNRAAAYLKIEQYHKAIEDCDFALRIDDKWIKAYVLMGKSYQKLHKFDEAKEKFEMITTIDDTKTKLVSDCIAMLHEDEENYKLEMDTQSKEAEAMGIRNLITSLGTKNLDVKIKLGSSNLMYYAGGLRMLQTLLIDEQSRTLFRTEGGFKMLLLNESIFMSLKSVVDGGKDSLPHSNQIVSSFISVCTSACTEMTENLRNLLAQVDMPQILLNSLESYDDHVKRNGISFFHEMTHNPASRTALIMSMDCNKLARLLLKPNTRKADANSAAAATLCNLCLEKKFVKNIVDKFQKDLLGIYIEYINELGKSTYQALSLRMRSLDILALNPRISSAMSHDLPFVNGCIQALERCIGAFINGNCNPCGMDNLFQILINVIKSKKQEPSFYLTIVNQLRYVVKKIKDKDLLATSLHLVSLSVERCENAVDILMSESSMMNYLFTNLKMNDARLIAHSLKLICCCGRSDVSCLKPLLILDKDYTVIRDILMNGEEDSDKVNQGQMAYLIGLLSAIPRGLHPLLDGTTEGNLVRRLLVLCRELPDEQASTNCAIALGKLARYDARFLEELRKHDGINILARRKAPV